MNDRLNNLNEKLLKNDLNDNELQIFIKDLISNDGRSTGNDEQGLLVVEEEDLKYQEKLLLSQILFNHFYNEPKCSINQFKDLLNFRIRRNTDDQNNLLTNLLTMILVELFNVENFNFIIHYGHNGDDDSIFNNPDNIIDLHAIIVNNINDPCLLLCWSFILSKITQSFQQLTDFSELPKRYLQLFELVLPNDNLQPLYQLLYSKLFQPSFNLFNKLFNFFNSQFIIKTSNFNSLAFKSILKGLLDATLSIIHPSFIDDFDSLINSFNCLLSSSSIEVSAPLAHQFWSQFDSQFPASIVLDVSRGRWPLDFFSLVNLLTSLTGSSQSKSNAEDSEHNLQAIESSDRVFLYFSQLPTYTTLFDGNSIPSEIDPLLRTIPQPTVLKGLDQPLDTNNVGRQLSPLNQPPPSVICWNIDQSVSGWYVIGRLLLDWLSYSRSMKSFKKENFIESIPLFDNTDDRYNDAVLASLQLIFGILNGNPELAPLLISNIAGTTDENDENQSDLVAILFAIIDKCLSTLTNQRNINPILSKIVASSINILTSLLQTFPGRVWTFLRGGNTLFTPQSPILLIDKSTGTYQMLMSLLTLAHSLFTESQQTVLSADSTFNKLKFDVLQRIITWSINDIWIEHVNWRYAHLGDKLNINLILSKLYTDILGDNSEDLKVLIKNHLLTKATATTLAPLVYMLSSSGNVITKLYTARRIYDAELAESCLEASLTLAHTLLASEKDIIEAHYHPSLLRFVFFDRSAALAAGATHARDDSKPHELVDVLASYISSKDSTHRTSLESARLLGVLCAYTAPSSTLAGFFADPHMTVSGLIDIIANPYSDNTLRAAVWDLCAVIVATQPGLATLLLTGQSVGAATRELIKERGTQSHKEERELKRTALDIASDNVEIWSQLWKSSPPLLSSVMRFLDVVWQNLEGHLLAVKKLRTSETFWNHLTEISLKDTGEIPSVTVSNDTDSLIEDGSDRDVKENDIQSLSKNVVDYAHRLSSSSFALSIIANDTSSSTKCYESIFKKLSTLVNTSMINSCDIELHSNVRSSISTAFSGLKLNEFQCIINRNFGLNYVFNIDLLKIKLEGFMASENIDEDLVEATLDHVRSLNLDWTIVDAQMGYTRSVNAFITNTSNVPLKNDGAQSVSDYSIQLAIDACFKASQENRQGEVMTSVHAERLFIILHLLELTVKRQTASDKLSKSTNPELLNHVEKLINLKPLSVIDSYRRKLSPSFHIQAIQIVFLTMRVFKDNQINLSTPIQASLKEILSSLIECMSVSLDRSKDDISISDEDFDLLVVAFMSIIKSRFSPPIQYWLPLLISNNVIPLSLDVLNRIPHSHSVGSNDGDEGIQNQEEMTIKTPPSFLQPILDLHLILASFEQSAERLALEGLIAAYSTSTIVALAEDGKIQTYDSDYIGIRNPWHLAWCRLLSVVISLVNVLGSSSQFIDVEIIGFIQLCGSQLASALSWSTNSSFTLPLIEELKMTISLFVSIANSEHYALTSAYRNRTLPSKSVLNAFNIRAVYLLQHLTYSLTHPHLLLQLVEPITALDREKVTSTSTGFSDELLSSFLGLTNDVLFGITLSLDSMKVLARQRPEWPSESYAIVQPNANININEMASFGTLFDLASYCIDTLKSSSKNSDTKSAASNSLEATLILTVTQMAMWIVSHESTFNDRNVINEILAQSQSEEGIQGRSASERIKRDISGGLSEDFCALVDRSKGVLGSQSKIPVIVESFIKRYVKRNL